MNKVYPERINWEDEPSVATPLSASNLNKIDYATYEMDNRIIALDTGKANQVDELLDIKEVAYNPTTGVWTFTHQNGTTDTFDQNIEKIPVTFAMDENGVITMTTADGTTYTCDVGTLIKTYTFVNSGNIQFTVTTDEQGNKSVTANIIDGSVTRAKLDPNLLSQIDIDVASASASATAASGSATTASNKALDSEAYAIGTRGGVPVTSEDPAYENNAKYYAEQAEQTDIGQVNNEIADIVNVYGAKNFVPYPYDETTKTENGITFTDNGDGTVTANGTATAEVFFIIKHISSTDSLLGKGKYIFSGCPSGGTAETYRIQAAMNDWSYYVSEYGDGEIINITDETTQKIQLIRIDIRAGVTVNNLTFKPMIRCASISDDTYVPYVPTNAKLDEEKISWDDASESVQKNLIPYPYYETTKTGNGITFTDNGDGTVTVNGTATNRANFWFEHYSLPFPFIYPNGSYLLSDGGAGSGSSGVSLFFAYYNGTTWVRQSSVFDNGEIPITISHSASSDYDRTLIGINVKKGTTVNNLTFKPMLRKATIKDDTYAPYAMTNYELTQKIAELQAQINALV